MANQLRSIRSIATGVAAAGIAFGVASAAGRPIVGAATAASPLSLAESPHWYRVPNPAAGRLVDVDVVSADVAWAVAMPWLGGPAQVLAFRAGAWQEVYRQRNIDVMAIDMPSATDGWAVGFELGAGTRSVLLPIRDGIVGPVERAPCRSLWDVQLSSATEGWAVGHGGSDGSASCIVQLHDGSWSTVPSPDVGLLSGLAMMDAARGWAISDEGHTLRFDGGAWRDVPGPAASDSDVGLQALSLSDMDNGWAVGWTTDGASGFTLRLANGRWTRADVGLDVLLFGVDVLSDDRIFAAGTTKAGADRTAHLLRFQNGLWREEDLSRAPGVALLYDVDMIAPDDGWAVGGHDTLRYGVPAVHASRPAYLPALFDGARSSGRRTPGRVDITKAPGVTESAAR